MRRLRSALGRLALGLAVAGGLAMAACGGSKEGPGHGTVLEVDREARTVTLDHGDIPGLMKGMTMTFGVAADVPIDHLDPGDEVDFRLREDAGTYTVTEIGDSGS